MREREIHISKPAVAGFFYMASNILAKAVALFTTPLFTRLLSPSDFGLYSLYTSWLGVFSVIMALGLSGGAVYRALGKFSKKESELLSGAFGIIMLSFGVFLTALLLLGKTAERLFSLPQYILAMLLCEVFLNTSETLLFASLRYKYAYLKICIINLLYAVLSPGVSVLLIYYTPFKAEARIFASFAVSAALILPEILLHLRKSRLYNKEIWGYLLKLSLPLLPYTLSMTLIAQSDKIMIEHYGGTADLAKYSVAYSLGFMLTTLTSALYSSLQPWIMRKLNTGEGYLAKRITEKIIKLISLGLLLFLLFTPELFSLIAAPEYRSAEAAVYPLAIAGVFQFTLNILTSNIIHTEKTLPLSFFSLTSLAVNLVLNFIFIPSYGYRAAALTTALSYLILMFFEYLYLKKRGAVIADLKSFMPLFTALFAIPIYLLREYIAPRAIFALAVLLIALPPLISLLRELPEHRKSRDAFSI